MRCCMILAPTGGLHRRADEPRGLRFLTSAATLAAATPNDARKLITDLEGDAALKPQRVAEGEVLVDASARIALIKHLDALHAEPCRGPQQDDLVVSLSEIEAKSSSALKPSSAFAPISGRPSTRSSCGARPPSASSCRSTPTTRARRCRLR
jgi:hypothetical protein